MDFLLASLIGVWLFQLGHKVWATSDFQQRILIYLLMNLVVFSIMVAILGNLRLPHTIDRIAIGLGFLVHVSYFFKLIRRPLD